MPTARLSQLSDLIDRISRGKQPAATSLTVFSDLSRGESEQLRAMWPSFPTEARLAIVMRTTELAEVNVDVDFTQLGLIGLADTDPDVRLRAAESLFESPQRAVAEQLLFLLQEDPVAEVRSAAADSLCQFVMLLELGHFDARLGNAIVLALRAVFENVTNNETLRANALESLGARSLPWVADLIAEAYNDDDRGLRLAALGAMGYSAEERWLDYIEEQFYSEDPEFRHAAVISAAQVGSEQVVASLASLIADDDSEVVLAVIAALGEIGGEEALEVLTAYAETAPAEFAELVADAIQTAAEFSSGRRVDDEDYQDEPVE